MDFVHACPYPWCSDEDVRPCSLSGLSVSHLGQATVVEASHDRVSVRVVGVPGHEDEPDVFVEVGVAERLRADEYRDLSTFLTAVEIDELVEALVAARAAAAERPS